MTFEEWWETHVKKSESSAFNDMSRELMSVAWEAAERDAVRECERMARRFQSFAKEEQSPLLAGYGSSGKHIAGEIRNRYPQHFKEE